MKSLVFLFVLVAILAVTQAAVKFVCEHRTLSLACKSGEVISVTSALYGRTIGGSRCPHSAIKTTKCRSTKSLDVVKSACNGKQACKVLAKNHVFGDPCVGTFKYLEVQYSCQPVVLSKFVCEHRTLSLACKSGEVISVTSALYGRTIGGSRCPHSAIKTTKCRSTKSLDVVKSACNGKQACKVLAKNHVFGDPCVGTFKYLEVKYSCQTGNGGQEGQSGSGNGKEPGAGSPILLKGRPTRQSSTGWGGAPGRAVDGNPNARYGANSCTHTNHDQGAWWRVDMGKNQCVGKVVLYNRADCCRDRIRGAVVRVGDESTPLKNKACTGNFKDINKGSANIQCDLTGRYLSVNLPGKNYLTICEVKVFSGNCAGSPILLKGRPTRQSSTGWGGAPGRAVDGNPNARYGANSCTHTNHDQGAWWRVDMGKNQCVGKVVLYNRADCCRDRIRGAVVRVGDESTPLKNKACTGNFKDINKGSANIQCDLKGRYLSVNLPGKNYLTICEVKVFSGNCAGNGGQEQSGSGNGKEPGAGCDAKKQFNGKCYKVGKVAKNYADAEKDCVAFGGHLARIVSNAENQFVKGLAAGQRCWIGYNDKLKEGFFQWAGFNYKNWNGHEPNNCCGGEHCVEMYRNGKWNDNNCGKARPYVCESAKKNGKCATGFGITKAGGNCYFIGPSKNFKDAATQCSSKGGYLARIGNQAENDFIKSKITANSWFSLTDQGSEGNFYSVGRYQNWQGGEPNNWGKGEDCTEMYASGKWNDLSCGSTKKYICKKW